MDISEKSKDAAGDLDDAAVVSIHVVESQGFDTKATGALLRKLDLHIIPFMSLIYLYAPPPNTRERRSFSSWLCDVNTNSHPQTLLSRPHHLWFCFFCFFRVVF